MSPMYPLLWWLSAVGVIAAGLVVWHLKEGGNLRRFQRRVRLLLRVLPFLVSRKPPASHKPRHALGAGEETRRLHPMPMHAHPDVRRPETLQDLISR